MSEEDTKKSDAPEVKEPVKEVPKEAPKQPPVVNKPTAPPSNAGSRGPGNRSGPGGRGGGRDNKRRRENRFDANDWNPTTGLGRMVKAGKITNMSDALSDDLPLREPQIVDHLMGESLVDEVLKVNMVQRMTDSGRRTRFSITVVVGNGDGYVGLGAAKGKEVGPTIKKAIDNAKLNMVELVRGCGSWRCGCMNPHSLPFKVEGKSGSTLVTLRPAPMGVGLAVGDIAKKMLKLAGIKDAWGFSRGQTKTTVNNAKAVMDALKRINAVKVQESQRVLLEHKKGALGVPEQEIKGGDDQ
ncbi:MAG: 30S ribosomal protein S5 [Thermoplasmata archaeon]|nr:30S ribosomal protein S5 [Thermoplasmata archaeon]